jgi:chromate transporter
MILLKLFFSFFKIGSFAIGGGYVILPLLQEEALSNGWMEQEMFVDMIAVSQITPGPIAINMATFVGYEEAGVAGALVASFAVTLPSFLILMFLSIFFFKFYESRFVKNLFGGLRPTATGLVAAAGFQIALIALLHVDTVFAQKLFSAFDWRVGIVFLISFILLLRYKLHPIPLVAMAGTAGILFC